MLIFALIGAGCQPDYVHVFAEGSSVELSSAPVTVRVDLFGGGAAVAHEFVTQFKLPTQGEASSQYADFNVILEDGAPALVDLRVSVTDTPTPWSTGLLLQTPGEERTVHLLLLATESPIAAARVADHGVQTMALFSTGVVMAWIDAAGVSVRIERVPDSLTGRSDLIATDPAAANVRAASRPGAPVNVGPDMFALTWIGGDGSLRLLAQKDNDRSPTVTLGDADGAQVAVAYAQSSHAIVTVARTGADATVRQHDESGAVQGQFALAAGDSVRKLRALVTTPDGGVCIALETAAGWRLLRLDADGTVAATMPVDGEITSIALSEDAALLHAAIVSGAEGGPLELRSFYAGNLEPFTDDATIIEQGMQLASSPFARVSLSSCGVVWSRRRDDNSDAFDLWAVDLDNAGVPSGEPRLLNGLTAGVHFAPTLRCITSTRAYASFLSAANATSQTGTLMFRRLPPAPVQQ